MRFNPVYEVRGGRGAATWPMTGFATGVGMVKDRPKRSTAALLRRRARVYRLHHAGHSTGEIAVRVGLSPRQVQRIVARGQELIRHDWHDNP